MIGSTSFDALIIDDSSNLISNYFLYFLKTWLNIFDMPKIWMDVIDIQVNLEPTNKHDK